ncbi:MAG: cupin domain-containing protein [Actinomycetota bacterium]
MGERRVVPVDDLTAAIAEHEAAGFRLTTISPADDPRWADLDGPEAVRLDRTAVEPATILVDSTPLVIPELDAELVISRAADADHGAGRAGMRYRDLIPGRLGGRFIASHIAIPGGGPVPDYVHHHDIRFQLIFCHAGWVEVVYEDQGDPFVMRPGDCVIQPPGIRHRVLASGDDLEVVEIGCPAEHDTHRDHELVLPNGIGDPDRSWNGQRFIRHVCSDASWDASPRDGWEWQRFGIDAVTDELAEARLARTPGPTEPWALAAHDLEFAFIFCRSGELRFATEAGEIQLSPGDSISVPAGLLHAFGTMDAAEMFVVTLPG